MALWIAATHAQPAWAARPAAGDPRPGEAVRQVPAAGHRGRHLPRPADHRQRLTRPPSTAPSAPTPRPRLLVDEADTIFGGKNADANEDLRGLLNAGHQRNRPAIRWDAGTRSLETIPTFAMAALAGIGAMPDTIEDRAVVIRMRRRAPGETVAPFRHRRDRPALTDLAAQLARLARQAPGRARNEPSRAMPLEDRAADTWEPLIAVADLAGGHWPEPGPARRRRAHRRPGPGRQRL